MKKLLLFLLIAAMLLSLVACGGGSAPKGEKVTLESETYEGDEFVLSADFYYPENAGIKVEGDDPTTKKFVNEKENYVVDISLFEDTTFDANKEYAEEEEETYKEFKIAGYDSYGYEDFGGYWIYVHLEEVSETTDRYLTVEINRKDFSEDGLEGVAAYEENEVAKGILDSLVYNGVVKIGEEAE